MTFTGAIGAACMFPLRAIIAVCVALRIHPNVLTLVGVIINFAAAWQFAVGRVMTEAKVGAPPEVAVPAPRQPVRLTGGALGGW